MDCTDFMILPSVPHSLALSFKRNEVCTSYVNWDKEHPDAPAGIGYDPPGVAQFVGYNFWQCCGGCILEMESADILYFSTAPPPSCPSVSSAAGPRNPPSMTAPAMERRGISTDPSFMVLHGSTL